MPRQLKNSQLILYLKELLNSQYDNFIKALPEKVAFRANSLKITNDKFEKFLKEFNQPYEKTAFNHSGYIIDDNSIQLSHTLAYFLGEFHYQGISSQVPVLLLDIKPGQRVMDMAAAPGSKSTQIAIGLKNTGELVLNDASTKRQKSLNSNMQRCGATNYYILNMRGESLGTYFNEYFDKVLVDAPCTALGTLAEHPEIESWWSLKKLKKITSIQYHLLVSAIKALKVGGELVYSTCSIAPEENEMIIEEIVEKYPVEIISGPEEISRLFSHGFTRYKDRTFSSGMEKAIRIWPHIHSMEGFFAIKLIKKNSIPDRSPKIKSEYIDTLSSRDDEVRLILNNLTDFWGIPYEYWYNYRYILTKTRIWMVSNTIKRILKNTFLSAGLLLGEKRLFGWKLVNGSVQVLSENIQKRRIELPDYDLRLLFSERKIKCSGLDNGYYALERNNHALASVYVDNCEMKIRLPHSFNLVL